MVCVCSTQRLVWLLDVNISVPFSRTLFSRTYAQLRVKSELLLIHPWKVGISSPFRNFLQTLLLEAPFLSPCGQQCASPAEWQCLMLSCSFAWLELPQKKAERKRKKKFFHTCETPGVYCLFCTNWRDGFFFSLNFGCITYDHIDSTAS